MASTVRSRRRATAIAVPGTVAVLLAGAFAPAPALAASNSSALPFPSVCPTGQSPTASASTASSSPSTSAGPTASPTASASPSASASSAGSAASPKAAATSSASATTAVPAPSGSSARPSASASPSASSDTGGFWGWLNGVWTWIVSDAPRSSSTGSTVEDAVAPLSGGAHVVEAAAGLGARQAEPSPAPSCIPAAEASSLAAAAAASPSEGVTASTIPWVMKTPNMVAWGLTFNGVKSVQVWDPSSKAYVAENVLDFTADSLTITSMVTYSIQNGQTVYNNAGASTTTTLTNPHLMVRRMSADLYGLLGQTYDPDHLPPLPVGLKVPLPIVFTNVTSVIAYLNTQSIQVPGFNGFASNGIASPQ
jgi:hypothetical protein